MAKKTWNPGTAPTGVGGDTPYSANTKHQSNADELYAHCGADAEGNLPAAQPLNKGGTGATTAEQARQNLGLGTAAVANTGTSSGNVMAVGAFGLGATIPPTFPDSFAAQAAAGSGFYYTPTTTEVGDGQMIYVNRGYWIKAIHLPVNTVAPRMLYATSASSSFAAYNFLLSGLNTTTDANGFIKSASPIVQLYVDKIELNDEAKLQTITFEKLGVGDYLIQGSSGFAQEGWYVEQPKDANGNVFHAVLYETFSVHDKFHRTLILSGFCFLKIAKISLNSSFFPKPIKR